MEIVGVVAPDSASGDLGAISARAAQLVDDGADLVDIDTVVGGARPLDVRRLARLVRRLVAEGVPVGVTTTSADAVVGAVDAGARVVCDPSGGTLDRFMPRIVAAAGVPYVLGQSVVRDGQCAPATPWEFRGGAARRVGALLEAGVAADLIILDSGVGQFSHGESEWEVLDHLEHLAYIGHPVFVDATRPALFAADDVGSVVADDEEEDATAIGVCVVAAGANAWGVRVGNVARASAVLRGARPARSRHGVGTQTR
jgi:dihydropteroate synthase